MSRPDAIRPLVARAIARVRTALDGGLPILRVRPARLPVAPGRADAPHSVRPGLDARPAPMRPLHPPAALNDNPLTGIHEAVERELRARGHLR